MKIKAAYSHLLLTLDHKVSLPLLANFKMHIDAKRACYDFGTHRVHYDHRMSQVHT